MYDRLEKEFKASSQEWRWKEGKERESIACAPFSKRTLNSTCGNIGNTWISCYLSVTVSYSNLHIKVYVLTAIRANTAREVSLLGKPRHQNTVRLLGYWHDDTDLMILYEYMSNGSLWEALHGPVASQGGEVSLLGKLRHRNIVRLLGNQHNDTDMMILYECMPNGSLWEAGQPGGTVQCGWLTSTTTAILRAFTGTSSRTTFLLDSNLEIRIADFGLARVMLMMRKNEAVSIHGCWIVWLHCSRVWIHTEDAIDAGRGEPSPSSSGGG